MLQFIKKRKFTLLTILAAFLVIMTICLLYSVDNATNTANLTYIRSFGWQVDDRPTEISHLTIPDEFDVVDETYNDLEKKAGFDITSYKGVRVTRYSYRVNNHTQSDKGMIRANVFVADGKIIAADLCSLDVGGFITTINDTSGLVSN